MIPSPLLKWARSLSRKEALEKYTYMIGEKLKGDPEYGAGAIWTIEEYLAAFKHRIDEDPNEEGAP
jgi:hypothetical protein